MTEQDTTTYMSYSGLKTIDKSPLLFTYNKSAPPVPTKAMTLGKALHAYILEPEKFFEKYEFVKTVSAANVEKHINNSSKDLFQAAKIRFDKFVEMYSFDLDLIEHKETFLYSHSGRDTPFKCYYDAVSLNDSALIDIKSIADISDANIDKEIYNLGYHIQAYIYSKCYEANHGEQPIFYFVFIGKTAPFERRIVTLTQDWFDIAESDVNRILDKYYDYIADPNQWILDNTQRVSSPAGWIRNKYRDVLQ